MVTVPWCVNFANSFICPLISGSPSAKWLGQELSNSYSVCLREYLLALKGFYMINATESKRLLLMMPTQNDSCILVITSSLKSLQEDLKAYRKCWNEANFLSSLQSSSTESSSIHLSSGGQAGIPQFQKINSKDCRLSVACTLEAIQAAD